MEPREDAAAPGAAEPLNERDRLRALVELDILDTLPEREYDDVARLASQITGTPIGLITLVDEKRQWFKARHQFPVPETSRDVSFCAHAILAPTDVMIVADALKDPRFATNPLVLGEPKIRFYAGAPLVTPRGEALGTLCVIDRVPRELVPEQREALNSLARVVMHLLDQRKTTRALARALGELARAEELLSQTRPLVRRIVADLLQVGGLQPATLRRLGRKFSQELPAGSVRDLAAAYTRAALGQVDIQETRERTTTFHATGLVEVLPDARTPTCHLTLGFLEGACARASGEPDAVGTETRCQSRGDDTCTFVVRAGVQR